MRHHARVSCCYSGTAKTRNSLAIALDLKVVEAYLLELGFLKIILSIYPWISTTPHLLWYCTQGWTFFWDAKDKNGTWWELKYNVDLWTGMIGSVNIFFTVNCPKNSIRKVTRKRKEGSLFYTQSQHFLIMKEMSGWKLLRHEVWLVRSTWCMQFGFQLSLCLWLIHMLQEHCRST